MLFIVHTANILGSFSDPFEFEGDYGPEMNPVRQKVFELLVAKEALNPLDPQAVQEDRLHGPRLSEIVNEDLLSALEEKQKELQDVGFSLEILKEIKHFLHQYADQKMFYFFRNNHGELLSLDKILRDKASRESKDFDLPIVSSIGTFNGRNAQELKKNLMEKLLLKEVVQIAKPEAVLRKSIDSLDENFLKQFLGERARNEDLNVFCTPVGQAFFYWLYQALNLHLVSMKPEMIEQINKVKLLFAATLGNAQLRAETFRDKLEKAGSVLVFTQECDALTSQKLEEGGFFLPVDKQNPQDGVFVFLKSDFWKNDPQIIPLKNYEGYLKGRVSLILAKTRLDGKQFLLASSHGNSTKPEDGRLQIQLIKEKFNELRQSNADLQLLIGIDANTKSDKDVRDLRKHLDVLGLVGTEAGPTTIKRRMVSVQHAKVGHLAIDEEDYLISLKTESGGDFLFNQLTVGFSEERPDISNTLPNMNNLSDHYPVGVTLVPVSIP